MGYTLLSAGEVREKEEAMMSRQHGFTLVEIMIVVLIIMLLLAILFPVLSSAQQNAKSAVCQGNLRQIGSALMQYRQDYGYYPTPDNPMGSLVLSGKLAAKITCVNDPVSHNDSYAALYNYWGYEAAITPQPLATQALANGVYGKIQGTYRGVWSPTTTYNRFDSVNANNNAENPQYYVCYAKNLGIQPGATGNNWNQYWKMGSGNWWNLAATPPTSDSDFPGLVNPYCPGTTIVTICPYHLRNHNRYPLLRADGSTELSPNLTAPPSINTANRAKLPYDDLYLNAPGDLFWTLSLQSH